MIVRTDGLERAGIYKILTGLVAPRPIAWVGTLNEEGGVNLAPFSAYTYVSIKPPMLGINMARREGQRKDTARNILREGHFVVNVVDQSLIEPMHQSALDYAPGVSEAQAMGLETVASGLVATPRLAGARASMECRFHSMTAFGDGGAEFYVGSIVAFHVRDDLLRDGKIDSAELDPVARLAGPNYARLGEIRTLATLTELAKTKL